MKIAVLIAVALFLTTSAQASYRYCGPTPGYFVDLRGDGTVAAFGGKSVTYEDVGSVGTGIPGRVYGADNQPNFSVISADNDDESFVTVVRNGVDAIYTRCR